jgi:hypothetical protein
MAERKVWDDVGAPWEYEKKVDGRLLPTASRNDHPASECSILYAAAIVSSYRRCEYCARTPKMPSRSLITIDLLLSSAECCTSSFGIRVASQAVLSEGARPFANDQVAPLPARRTSKRVVSVRLDIHRMQAHRLCSVMRREDKVRVMVLDNKVTAACHVVAEAVQVETVVDIKRKILAVGRRPSNG